MDRYELLIDAALTFDEAPPAPDPVLRSHADGAAGDRPGDHYNRRATWEEVLRPHGWAVAGHSGDKVYWRRPGKEYGWSATTGYCSSSLRGDLLYVFTTNAHPFEPSEDRGGYSKFEALALLEYRGDFSAAARALRERDFGGTAPARRAPDARPRQPSPSANGALLSHEGDATEEEGPDEEEVATAADLIRHNATIRWRWEGWVPIGSLTILASEPGIGKTRFCADLLRRTFNNLPWPDGAAPTCPPGSTAMWVAADSQHPELGSLPERFGFPPEALYLNAPKSNPFGGTMLDTAEDVRDFERRIAKVNPALVFIDTTLNATDRSTHKPEDAKAFFKPLMEVAQRTQTAIVCVTHLNVAGKPLGRRIEAQGRVVIMLERPDPEGQPFRRKLSVRKTHSLSPPPLGVTMGSAGNDYDDAPPEPPPDVQPEPGQAPETGLVACCAWLSRLVAQGPQWVQEVRDRAVANRFSTKTLYAARNRLDLVEEVVSRRKRWRFKSPDEVERTLGILGETDENA